MPDRCTPEYERVVAKMGSSLPYRRARALLSGFLPLDDIPTMETTRQRTLRVGARLEKEAVAVPTSKPAAEARSIALSIDGGHVRSARQYQGRSFEVRLAQVSNDEGKQVVFSSVPAEADLQKKQLRGVLHGLGAAPVTLVTILSDGAEGPRSLGEAASPGPTHHVLDWFHLSMRVQHVAQTAKSWPDAAEGDRHAGARLAETIERNPLASLAWTGQARSRSHWRNSGHARRHNRRYAADCCGRAEGGAPAARSRDIRIRAIRYYHRLRVARRCEEPILTAITESTVQ